MPAVASPPSTPQPGPTAIPVNMPAVPPAATPDSTAPSNAPATDHGPAPAPSKGLDEMFDRIGEKYGQDPAEAGKPLPKKPAAKTDEKAAEKEIDVPTPEKNKGAPDKKTDAKTADAKPVVAPKTEKSLGERYREERAQREKYETENLELRKLIQNPNERKLEAEKVTKLEAQNKELLEHIKFLDYQKHPEFLEKYSKPYDDKWNEVWSEVAGATIMENGEERKVEPADLIKLGNLPAHMLTKEAKAKFGEDLGPMVTQMVRELRGLSKAKFDALEKAKKDGADFFQKAQESEGIENQKRNEFLASTWEKSNQDLETHSIYGSYFKPQEGDDEWNAKLDKGKAFVKKAWEQSPLEKGISAEEQAARVKRQAKLQRCAESFSVQQLKISRLQAKLDDANKKLSEYESSTPKIEGGQVDANGSAPAAGYTIDSFESNLTKYARPGIG